jgi:hypothetical protein
MLGRKVSEAVGANSAIFSGVYAVLLKPCLFASRIVW